MNGTGKCWTRAAALTVILGYTGAASADHRGYPGGAETGVYLGGGITRVDVQDNGLFGFGTPELQDTSYKGYVGYAFSDLFRMELGIVDFGRYPVDIGFPGPGFQTIDLKADGTTVGAELSLPVAEDLAIFAKGGLMFWESNGLGGGFGFQEDGDDAFMGLGLRFRLAPNLEITGSVERYRLNETDVDVSTLGFALRF